jgi:hypothetical protein
MPRTAMALAGQQGLHAYEHTGQQLSARYVVSVSIGTPSGAERWLRCMQLCAVQPTCGLCALCCVSIVRMLAHHAPAQAFVPSSTHFQPLLSVTYFCSPSPSAQNVGQSSCAASGFKGGGIAGVWRAAAAKLRWCSKTRVAWCRTAQARKAA